MPVAVRAIGSTAAGTGNITVNYPTRSDNDILLLFTESNPNEPVNTVTAGSGGGTWTRFINQGSTDSTLTVWWSRWTTGQASSAVVTDSGNHTIGGVMSISGCIETGDPFEGTTSTNSTSTTSGVIPSVTTTFYNTLIIGAITSGRDNNFTAEFSGYTNSNLLNIEEQFDSGTNQGAGGGFGVFAGFFNNVGQTDTTSVTIANATAYATGAFALIGTDSTLPHIGWGVPV